MNRTIIIGYGNPDRQDDGVAWHVMLAVAKLLGIQPPISLDEPFSPQDESPEFLFNLQLVPELGERISAFQRVCFIDAHTGAIPEEVRGVKIDPHFQHSPFTHHMTPETCLEIARTLYGSTPEAFLVSVRGYEFGFDNNLSQQTAALVPIAAGKIMAWIRSGELE